MTDTSGLQPGAGFEGGWICEGLADDALLECGVCWRVYDPKVGDSARFIPPNTPFLALPDDWRCPECAAEKAKYMVVDAGKGPKRGPAVQDMQTRLDALLGAYRDADFAMAALPIYNPALQLNAVGFAPFQDGYVGALITPWFLNLVLLPKKKNQDVRSSGATRSVVFPSGAYVFSWVNLERVGGFEFCSLFSPMLEFENQEAARLAAEAALAALLTPAPQEQMPPEVKSTAPVDASRRTLLFGRARPGETVSPR